ncbi:hypothetical protein EJ065_0308 [Corallococcus coralloides]|uniref:Uncharacterized protein n=1 Tax=Corallococcus coralloides TaxID=184914 RepID=A0A410RJ11_CORCK|nr:hypothetical protein EJ065_0308 [Corallococcus coralloides]
MGWAALTGLMLAGMTAAPDVLPSGVPLVCFFGIEPSSGSSYRLSFFST